MNWIMDRFTSPRADLLGGDEKCDRASTPSDTTPIIGVVSEGVEMVDRFLFGYPGEWESGGG